MTALPAPPPPNLPLAGEGEDPGFPASPPGPSEGRGTGAPSAAGRPIGPAHGPPPTPPLPPLPSVPSTRATGGAERGWPAEIPPPPRPTRPLSGPPPAPGVPVASAEEPFLPPPEHPTEPPALPPLPPAAATALGTPEAGGERRRLRTGRLVIVLVGLAVVLGSIVALIIFFQPSGEEPGPSKQPAPPPVVAASPLPVGPVDADQDGLTDDVERTLGTNPEAADSDGDTYTDAQELAAGYDPKGPGKLDTDADALPDPEEAKLGTDPRNADTDGDGYFDGREVQNCYDPRIPSPQDSVAACPPYPGL